MSLSWHGDPIGPGLHGLVVPESAPPNCYSRRATVATIAGATALAKLADEYGQSRAKASRKGVVRLRITAPHNSRARREARKQKRKGHPAQPKNSR